MTTHVDRMLFQAARRGDRRARERLVRTHLPTVRAVDSHYRDLGLPFDDLVQEGALGLLEAIDRYDPGRGVAFDAFARFRIRRAIRNALTDSSRLIRLPKQIVERRRAIERAHARLAASHGREPTTAEIAASLGLPARVVDEATAISVVPVSLDEPPKPEGTALESMVADAFASDPELETIEHEQHELLDEALGELPERQREILLRHYGLDRAPEEIPQVAASLHLSQQRTRTIEHDALYALAERLEAPAEHPRRRCGKPATGGGHSRKRLQQRPR